MKLIASSVVGSMTKLRSSITEPIVNFVKRVGSGVSSAWNYAKNTNVSDLPVIKDLRKDIKEFGKGLTDSMSSLKIKTPEINLGLGKGLKASFGALIDKIKPKKINSDMPVAELRTMWLEENKKIAEEGKKVA